MSASDISTIPVIDIAPLVERDPGADAVIEAIRLACTDTGFFLITGHDVPGPVIDRMRERSRAFFDLAAAQKARTATAGSTPGGVTYEPVASEALAASLGVRTPGDLKEMLDHGPEWEGDAWPDEPAGLREAWSAYFAAMVTLAAHLRYAFARAIGLPGDWFEDKFGSTLSSLRAINYPDGMRPQPGQLRAGAHSDYGFLTILLSEASPGGLEVQARTGEWVSVPTVEDAFVVNIGDVMQRWTNDAWVSTMHRVVNPPATAAVARRQSIAFFHNPRADAVISALDAFVTESRPARYPPVTYGQYAREMHDRTHAVAPATHSAERS